MYKYYSKKNKVKPNSKVLIIAGSDSSGGAGIQADIKTITALGSYAMTAITAITAQNTTGVKSIIPIPPKEILNQILFTAKDIKPDAIKIGMLHSSKVIDSVIKSFKSIKVNKIVVDPVMVAKGGVKLINGYGRILVRASGTESKIRVMGESENKKLLDYCLKIILAKIK